MVDLIRIKSPTSHLSLRRTTDGWELDDGKQKLPVSKAPVQRMVDELALTKTVRFEPATISALEKYGLDQPSLVVSFLSVVSENTPESTAGEQSVAELNFGSIGSDGLVSAHATGSPEIALVPKKTPGFIPVSPANWTSP